MATNRQALQQMTSYEIAEVIVSLIQCLQNKDSDLTCPLGIDCKFSVDEDGCDPWGESVLPCEKAFKRWLDAKENIKALTDDDYREQFDALTDEREGRVKSSRTPTV